LHFIQDGATPHFAPPVHVWPDNHLWLVEWVLEDQQNGLWEVLILLHMICFCGVGAKKKVYQSKLRKQDELEQQM